MFTITRCSLTQTTFRTISAGATFCLVALTSACDKVTQDFVPISDPTDAFVDAVRIVTTNDIMPTRMHFSGFPGDLGSRIDAAIKAEEWSEWSQVEHWGQELLLRAADCGEELPSQVAYYLVLNLEEWDENGYVVDFEGFWRNSDDSGHGKAGTITVSLERGSWQSEVVVGQRSTISWEGPVR